MGTRKYRQLSAATKQRMSQAHKNKRHSQTTKSKISKSMEEYWEGVKDNPTAIIKK